MKSWQEIREKIREDYTQQEIFAVASSSSWNQKFQFIVAHHDDLQQNTANEKMLSERRYCTVNTGCGLKCNPAVRADIHVLYLHFDYKKYWFVSGWAATSPLLHSRLSAGATKKDTVLFFSSTNKHKLKAADRYKASKLFLKFKRKSLTVDLQMECVWDETVCMQSCSHIRPATLPCRAVDGGRWRLSANVCCVSVCVWDRGVRETGGVHKERFVRLCRN